MLWDDQQAQAQDQCWGLQVERGAQYAAHLSRQTCIFHSVVSYPVCGSVEHSSLFHFVAFLNFSCDFLPPPSLSLAPSFLTTPSADWISNDIMHLALASSSTSLIRASAAPTQEKEAIHIMFTHVLFCLSRVRPNKNLLKMRLDLIIFQYKLQLHEAKCCVYKHCLNLVMPTFLKKLKLLLFAYGNHRRYRDNKERSKHFI